VNDKNEEGENKQGQNLALHSGFHVLMRYSRSMKDQEEKHQQSISFPFVDGGNDVKRR
jgi:hypothetical protein